MLVVCFVFLPIDAFTVLAGIQLLRKRTYHMALLGTIGSFLSCVHPCCLLNVPIGIWVLVVLMRPEVQSLFQTAQTESWSS